jgi:hypothetical protein
MEQGLALLHYYLSSIDDIDAFGKPVASLDIRHMPTYHLAIKGVNIY